ncbi:SH3 domain-containing protein [Streptomyces sp. t39]|uniref:SH3 domain-containing protein n=1 Tax=Streptomyces sp. t39 TaxID=1828156 RepID=UPI0011CDF173|nr:SH3 domain-containing protein [Streptomyces sp. t39]TXS52681.1 SH3 domain-containing protein [Streptomyces sp. t39]
MTMTTVRRVGPAAGLSSRIAAGVLAVGVALTVAAPAGAAAQAAPPAKPYGTVAAQSGLNLRAYPSTDSSVKGTLANRAQVGLVCKVRAQNIAGNDVWYLVRDSRKVWVPARYVVATGAVKYCKDVLR